MTITFFGNARFLRQVRFFISILICLRAFPTLLETYLFLICVRLLLGDGLSSNAFKMERERLAWIIMNIVPGQLGIGI